MIIVGDARPRLRLFVIMQAPDEEITHEPVIVSPKEPDRLINGYCSGKLNIITATWNHKHPFDNGPYPNEGFAYTLGVAQEEQLALT